MADRASPPRGIAEKFHSVELNVLAEILGEACRRDPRVERMIVLAALTGVRRGELCGLRWSDCDVERSTRTIHRAVKWSSLRGIEVDLTKTHAERSISLNALAVEVLPQ
ncbi:MAG: tyrosine-type recombinase/integrase [Ferrimicrobium sp.]